MARTIQTIYNEIITEKETMASLNGLLPSGTSYTSLLADLTSGSKTAIWRLWAYVVAVAHFVLESLWDAFKADVIILLAAAKYGTLPWYVTISKQFQLGDTLIMVGDFPGYAVVDESKQIVSHASATEGGGIVFVKVAKTATGGGLEPLTSGELTQFSAYMKKMKLAGVQLIASSLNADKLVMNVTIKYDPILAEATVESNVLAAITNYLSNLPFDAQFERLRFEDAIQAVEGVDEIIITSLTGVSGAVPTAFTQSYVAQAGYMVYDDVNSTLTMTPA